MAVPIGSLQGSAAVDSDLPTRASLKAPWIALTWGSNYQTLFFSLSHNVRDASTINNVRYTKLACAANGPLSWAATMVLCYL